MISGDSGRAEINVVSEDERNRAWVLCVCACARKGWTYEVRQRRVTQQLLIMMGEVIPTADEKRKSREFTAGVLEVIVREAAVVY